MRIVNMGVVDRMTWWKGTETIPRETFDMAILIVKRDENAKSFFWSEQESSDSVK
jgi:hypothetical protein